MKKKILFISEALWIGGIESALLNLLNCIDYDKYDITCLIVRGELELAHMITNKCRLIISDRDKIITFKKKYKFNRLYHLTEKSSNPSRLHKSMMCIVPMIKWTENRLYIKYIKKQMKEMSFDTCVIYSDRVAEIAIRAIRAKQFFLFYHNAIMERAYHDEIAYKKSKNIIAVSEKKMNELKIFRKKYSDKYISIHNLVNLSEIKVKSQYVPDVIFPKDAFNMVTCGRLAKQKAIDWAIIAMKSLLDKGFTNFHWWIIGGGPDEQKLLEMIKQYGISDNFHLLGMKQNPYPYIAAADLYIQPSRYENYSVAILEAMAMFKPILATVPAAEMQIKDGISGKLCEANPESISQSIEYLYSHRDEMNKYAEYLKENTLEEKNMEVISNLYKLFDGE